MVDQPAEARVGIAQRTVGSYEEYREAQRAIDRLSDVGFPVERVAVVGRDLRVLERVSGRVSPATAAWRSAACGLAVGALTGWMLSIFGIADARVAGAWLAVNGAVLGAVFGAVIGLIEHLLTRGRRDVMTVSEIRADRYDVVADADFADRAAHLL